MRVLYIYICLLVYASSSDIVHIRYVLHLHILQNFVYLSKASSLFLFVEGDEMRIPEPCNHAAKLRHIVQQALDELMTGRTTFVPWPHTRRLHFLLFRVTRRGWWLHIFAPSISRALQLPQFLRSLLIVCRLSSTPPRF